MSIDLSAVEVTEAPVADPDATNADATPDGGQPGAPPSLSTVHDAVAIGVAGERVEVSDSLVGAAAAGEMRAKDTLILVCAAGELHGENVRVLVTPGLAVLIGAVSGLALAVAGRLLGRGRPGG